MLERSVGHAHQERLVGNVRDDRATGLGDRGALGVARRVGELDEERADRIGTVLGRAQQVRERGGNDGLRLAGNEVVAGNEVDLRAGGHGGAPGERGATRCDLRFREPAGLLLQHDR